MREAASLQPAAARFDVTAIAKSFPETADRRLLGTLQTFVKPRAY